VLLYKSCQGFLLLWINLSGVRCPPGVRVVANGSLDLTAREIVLQAFLFDLAKIDAAKEFTVQRQILRSNVTELCNCFVTRVRIYRFLRAASIKALAGALLSLARC
jgi:hypothetical protein